MILLLFACLEPLEIDPCPAQGCPNGQLCLVREDHTTGELLSEGCEELPEECEPGSCDIDFESPCGIAFGQICETGNYEGGCEPRRGEAIVEMTCYW